MDRGRIWLTRIVAPIAFLAAVVVLVLLVQRGLDETSSAGSTAPGSGATVDVTTDLVETQSDTEPAKRAFYRVKTGDTLEAIASQFETSVEVLLELNPGVDPLALEPGQRLRVS